MIFAAMTLVSLATTPHVEITEVAYDQTDVTYTEAFPDCARGLRPSLRAYRIEHPAVLFRTRGLVEVAIYEPDLHSCHVAGDMVETPVTFRVTTRGVDGDTLIPGLNFAADYNLVINGKTY